MPDLTREELLADIEDKDLEIKGLWDRLLDLETRNAALKKSMKAYESELDREWDSLDEARVFG